MSPDFVISKGDLLPVLPFQCQYKNGTFADLTGATSVKFVMELEGSVTEKINTAVGVTVLNPLLQPGSTLPHGTYSWSGTDTDTTGDYRAWIVVTFPSGKPLHFPNYGSRRVQVTQAE